MDYTEIECQHCGVITACYNKIRRFGDNIILEVCGKCTDEIRARNIEQKFDEGGT